MWKCALSWVWWFGFKLEPIFYTAPTASKIMLASKVAQNRLKNIQLNSLI